MNDEKYNYTASVRSDVDDYIKEHVDGYIDDAKRDELYDEMFVSDSVTGNASGSYTMSTWKAESYLCHNGDLLKEAIDEFGGEFKDPESNDVTIRCYLLGQILCDAVDDWNEEHPELEDGEGESPAA